MRGKKKLFAAVLETLETRRLMATVTVTSTADTVTPNDGAVTLREAITAINAGNDLSDANITAQNPAATDAFGTNDTINFNIPGGGVQTIKPTSALPTITKPVLIDGYSQSGSSVNTLAVGDNATLLIELDGENAPAGTNGLGISGGNTTVRGLIINHFNEGLFLGFTAGSTLNTIAGNFLGTDATGKAAASNIDGIFIDDSTNNTIGGTALADRNILSGNTFDGIEIDGGPATGNTVVGNYIGVDATGKTSLANHVGVEVVFGANNVIGGSAAGAGNVISGNTATGVEIAGVDTTGNTILGNYIGLDATGEAKLASNPQTGVSIEAGVGNMVGGSAAGDRNIISGNSNGVVITQSFATGNSVLGNYIGTDSTGAAGLGNTLDGVKITGGASSNTIGGTTVGARNVLSGNSNGVGIFDSGTSSNTVEGNYIGTNAAGTKAIANTSNGILIDLGASSNTIGGTTAGAGNIISGNTNEGVTIEDAGSEQNLIEGNYIGTDITGAAPLGNGGDGVAVSHANNNTIGGTAAGAGNVISGNLGEGVDVFTVNALLIQGNLIGTDSTGTAPLGNRLEGIDFGIGGTVTIGGSAPGAGNIIAGNLEDGIHAQQAGINVEGNFIGTNPAGANLANKGNGISETEAFGTIGGTMPQSGNVIAFNLGAGVDLISGSEALIRFNSIYSNVGLGIDLNDDGITKNDPGDSDSGANDLQNFPVLASAITSAGSTTIQGGLNTNPNKLILIDFYATNSLAAGQGKTYIGSQAVVTDGNGNAVFTASFPGNFSGKFITATATTTDQVPDGETSEFSSPIQDLTPPPPSPTLSISDVSMNEGNSGTTAFTFTVTRSGDLSGASSLQYATADGSATVADGDYQPVTSTIGFDPNQATKTITVLVNGDTKYESDETFSVNLSNATGATIADASATGTIVNDDAPPTISIGNVSMKEGNSGTTEFDFPLTFSDNGPFSQNISFTVTTSDGTATVSDNDYQPVNGAGAGFASGTNLSGKFLPVFVNGDTKVEGNETFTVTISNASGVTIANATATGTIINDDSAAPPPPSSGSAKVVTDPCDSTKTALEIDGTDGKDTITVTKSGSSQGKAVVKINGVNKGTFSFSGSIVVYGKGGADNISIDSAITRGAYIWGGDGNDTVNGGGGNDIIFGQGNDDSLNGNSGRDILVGGDGTDKLNGGSGDDLLIAGDFKSAPSMSQLCSIQKEWDRTDKNYAARVKDLTNGGGYNTIKLNSSTLFSSTTLKDSLTGGADSDLFFAAMTGDKITDKASSETAVNIG